MSQYLVERIQAQPNVDVVAGCEIAALEGSDGALEAVSWRDRSSGKRDAPAGALPLLLHWRGAEHRLAGELGYQARRARLRADRRRGGDDRFRSKPAAAASSRSATYARARSSASRPRSAMARRWLPRSTLICAATRAGGASRQRAMPVRHRLTRFAAAAFLALRAAHAARHRRREHQPRLRAGRWRRDQGALAHRDRPAAYRRPIFGLAASAARARRLFAATTSTA